MKMTRLITTNLSAQTQMTIPVMIVHQVAMIRQALAEQMKVVMAGTMVRVLVPDPAETPQVLSAVRIKAYQNQLILSRQADTFLVDTAILELVADFDLTGS